jgi:hypothetical protein
MARKARTPQRGDSATNEEKRVKEEAIEEAKRKLRPLTATVRSWAIINVNDPDPRHSPKDEYHAAVGFIHCLLDPDPEKSGDARQAADNFLGGFAPIVRKFILPALRQGLPRKRQKGDPPDSLLLRDRWIAAVVEHICRRYDFDATRNEATKEAGRECGCSIVAEALKRLGIKRLGESQVATTWRQARQ